MPTYKVILESSGDGESSVINSEKNEGYVEVDLRNLIRGLRKYGNHLVHNVIGKIADYEKNPDAEKLSEELRKDVINEGGRAILSGLARGSTIEIILTTPDKGGEVKRWELNKTRY